MKFEFGEEISDVCPMEAESEVETLAGNRNAKDDRRSCLWKNWWCGAGKDM
jgi:hypothetical protein